MKNFYAKILAFALTAMTFGHAAEAQVAAKPNAPRAGKVWDARRSALVPQAGIARLGTGNTAKPQIFTFGPDGVKPTTLSLTPTAAETTADHSLPTSQGWGFLEGPDGSSWFYTEDFTFDTTGYYYTSATVTIYNTAHTAVGSFTYTVPKGNIVNAIQPYGTLTKKFFDRDDKTMELTLYVHTIGENYTSLDSIFAYRMDGTQVAKYPASTGLLLDASTNSWTTYQRYAMVSSETRNDTTYNRIDILRPASWGEDAPQVEHTFWVNEELANYAYGSYFNMFVTDDNVPYYAVAHYDKPLVSGYGDDWEPILNENVNYCVTVYDKNYNEVASIQKPVDPVGDSYLRMAGLGVFGDKDVSLGFYSGGDDFNFLITYVDYIVSSDDYLYTFDVYDSKGELIRELAAGVDQWSSLNDVAGQEEQVAFFKTVNDAVQVYMTDIPSGKVQTVIPSYIDGNLISTTLNRVAVGDTYEYLINMGQSATDDDNNTIARIGWYTRDLTPTKFTSFNLGPNGEYFTPYLSSDGLDPYLVNTDGQREFIYIAKIGRTDGSNKVDNGLVIASEDGTPLHTFMSDDEQTYYSGAVVNYGTSTPELFVGYSVASGDDAGKYKLDFYDLPFSKFSAGGDGTAENPYLIATPGDLSQMRSNLTACYKVTADLDLSTMPGAWNPIDGFAGQLDGDGHTISGLRIAGESAYRTGLFQSLLQGAVVKNLVFVNPTIELNKQNSYVGIVSGDAVGATLENIHIHNAHITDPTGKASAAVGGIVGDASLNSTVTGCSFRDSEISAAAASPVGGIVGQTRTSSAVTACVAEADITAESTVGGIVGSTDRGATVSDSHANINATANNTIGGIVGENLSRGRISRCYSEGALTATKKAYSGHCVGGIVGYLAPSYSASAADSVVLNSVAALSEINLPEGESLATDLTVHRIVGYSIANDEGSATIERKLVGNYAADYILVNGSPLSFTPDSTAASVDGATLSDDDMTPAFFTSTLDYAVGIDASAPWTATADLPLLWFEDKAQSFCLSGDVLVIAEDESAELTATLYGVDELPGDVVFESSNENLFTATVAEVSGNSTKAVIHCLNSGTCTITARLGDRTAQCTVIGTYPAGINKVKADGDASSLCFSLEGRTIRCEGAALLQIFSLEGRAVRSLKAGSTSLTGLQAGTYVVLATSPSGTSKAVKVAVK